MPRAEVIQTIERFQVRLLILDRRAAADLIAAYAPIWDRLDDEVDRLLAEAARRNLTAGELLRLERTRALQLQVLTEVDRFADVASGRILTAQSEAVALARESVRRIVDAALPLGIDTSVLARVGIGWNVLPARAFETFVGVAGDGSPLARLLGTLGPEVRQGFARALAEGIVLGRNPRQTAALVRNQFGVGLSRALGISRTETLRAHREATRLQYAANRDVVRGWERRSARDGSVCMACIALDGEQYETEEPIDAHPNCFPAGTLTDGPAPVAASQRFYAGELVAVRTASGKELSFTPNHPILTPGGWVAGGLLAVGRYVVSSALGQDAYAPRHVDNDHGPSPIEEVAESFRVITAEMPASAEDFHGDGVGSEVYVVRTGGLLRDDLDVALAEPPAQKFLCRRHSELPRLARHGPTNAHIDRVLLPSAGILGGRSVLAALLDSPARRQQTVRLSVRAPDHSRIGKGAADRVSRYAVPQREDLLRYTGEVIADELVEVRRYPFRGHVYNLQTTTGWYIANRIITHNCRCAMVPVTLRYRDLGLDVPEADVDTSTARDWFAQQPETVQRRMMGPGKYRAWQDGRFAIEDMARIDHSDVWGASATEKSLHELVPA